MDRIFLRLETPPAWPGWSELWVREADWLRAQIDRFYQADLDRARCYLWPGRRTSSGAGYLLGRRWARTRGGGWRFVCTHHPLAYVAWEYGQGPIPAHQRPVSICGTPLCWNPTHLELRPTRLPVTSPRTYER